MKINALKLRQSFGAILEKLRKTGEPIIIEKGRVPVAVLISIETFNKRFIDLLEVSKRIELLKAFKENAVASKEDSLKIIRELRYG
jgi:prevent-host-death family protein